MELTTIETRLERTRSHDAAWENGFPATANARAGELPFAPYRHLDEKELIERARVARNRLGTALLILGHHYQRDEVIAFADLRGDSLKLASLAAANRDCQYIVFCGVHFMAETADILTADDVVVILPDLGAGCSMADMADLDSVENCWQELGSLFAEEDVMPVTYINSAASLKAFCARHGGIVCTSSNSRAVLEWAFARRPRVLFFPDEHLGRNTGKRMGISLDEMVVWDPTRPLGGNDEQALRRARMILWKGYCSVHQMFRPAHVHYFRQRFPGIRILVHPECSMEVVDQADLVGSTEFIIRSVEQAPPGTQWAIGTELHLVQRLKKEHPEQEIHFLSTTICMCSTMYRIDLPHLCWALENLAQGTVVNQIRVPESVAHWARIALQRMLEVR
ncbi:MAG: quinolinate synthase [Gemmataceae bacterium]